MRSFTAGTISGATLSVTWRCVRMTAFIVLRTMFTTISLSPISTTQLLSAFITMPAICDSTDSMKATDWSTWSIFCMEISILPSRSPFS